MKSVGIIGLLIAFIAALVYFGYNNGQTPKNMPLSSSNPKQIQFSRPEPVIEAGKTYSANLQTTAGEIVIELDSRNTPIAANNFVFLARNGFYDNTIFHRVIDGFMIQGGDPMGDGTGGPGYQFNDEPIVGEYRRGTVAMANAGPNTNGSQFFIMHADYPLPKNYVIFGRVTAGLEVVDRIAAAPVQTSRSGENSHPVDPVVINSISLSVR